MAANLGIHLLREMLPTGVIVCLAVGLMGCDCRRQAESGSAKPVIAVSVFPVADLTARVAGDRWRVVTLLPPGHSPHEYTMRPAVAAELRAARVLVVVGAGLDDWAVRASEGGRGQRDVLVLTQELGLSAKTPASEPVHGPEGADTADDSPADISHDEHHDHEHAADDHAHGDEGHGHGEHHHHGHGDDPHIWLDPVLAGRIVDAVAGVLANHDPEGREVYERNAAALKEELAELDKQYRETLEACRTKTLIVFHAGYGHLARRYGLDQVSLLGLGGVTPDRLEKVIQLMRQKDVKAIYREPQFEPKWVEALSERAGAKVLVLDPLGHAERAGYDSYVAMMRSNLAALKEGLCNGS